MNLMKFRFLISTSCPDNFGASIRVSRAAPFGFPCVSPLLPRKPTCRLWQFSSGQVFQPSPSDHWVGNSTLSYEATYRFACAATRRFARLPKGAFVRELCASGYPPHLPPATWANCRTPTVGLQPTSHTFYTAYPTKRQAYAILEVEDFWMKFA